jgi:SAM-dependent methyltransferase
MTSNMAAESVSDYRGVDLEGRWAGRSQVTALERAFVRRAFDGADCRRLLEVGTGTGRLLEPLLALSTEVIASDFDEAALARLRLRSAVGSVHRVAANVYHLPFVEGAITGASMVRVYHHLDNPVAALREIGRVLRPGGRLLVSYHPRPSAFTLSHDIKRAIGPAGPAPFRSITFARRSVDLAPDPFPVHVARRADFAEVARAAGLVTVGEFASGFEEYAILRRLPTRLFVSVGERLGRAPGFPARLVVLAKPGTDSEPLPALDRIWACPRCRSELRADRLWCPTGDWQGRESGDVRDLRYVPAGAPRWEVGR